MSAIRLNSIWKFCSGIPFVGRYIFSWLVTFASPYTGTIPMRVVSLEPGKCKTSMTSWFWLKNPFNSIHVSALLNFGEATMGFAILSICEEQHLRSIPTRLEIDFVKKARGTLYAVCTVQDLIKEDESSATKIATTEIFNSSNELVCNVVGHWSVSRLKKDK